MKIVILFKVLLANKLDEDISLSYIGVVSPLFLSYFTLILMSFGAKGGNRCKYITVYIDYGLILAACCSFNACLFSRLTFQLQTLLQVFPVPFQMN